MINSASKFACILLLTTTAAMTALAGTAQNIYVRSTQATPWGQTTNEDAMDKVFGSGSWDTEYYETLDVVALLDRNTKFIFMEGGDSSYDGFADFIQNHSVDLYTWISNGGRLLILAAPNDPLNDVLLYLPNNVVLKSDAFYASAASSAYAVDISSSIFTGPFPAAYNFTGDFFSHGYFVGSTVSPIMQSNLNEVVLGQTSISHGLMVFGALTTDNFQLPQPFAHGLLINIIYYTATIGG
jgi:hypothetical protein